MDTTHAWRHDAAEAQQLDAARFHLLYSQSRLTFLFPLIAATALGVLLWGAAARALLAGWLAGIIALTAIRLWMLDLIQADEPGGAIRAHWPDIFAASALLSGLLWGAAPLIIVPAAPAGGAEPALFRGLVMLVVCGLAAGATVTYVISLRVWLSFTIPALLVPGIFLAAFGDKMNVALGGFVLLYLFFITVAGLRMNAQLRRYVELEYELRRLRRDLAATHGPAA